MQGQTFKSPLQQPWKHILRLLDPKSLFGQEFPLRGARPTTNVCERNKALNVKPLRFQGLQDSLFLSNRMCNKYIFNLEGQIQVCIDFKIKTQSHFRVSDLICVIQQQNLRIGASLKICVVQSLSYFHPKQISFKLPKLQTNYRQRLGRSDLAHPLEVTKFLGLAKLQLSFQSFSQAHVWAVEPEHLCP